MTATPRPADSVRVKLHRDVRVYGDTSILMGGEPLRALRLKPQASRLISNRELRVNDALSRSLAERLVSAGLASTVTETLPEASLADVTVIIPVKDRSDELDRALSAITGAVATIIVDDGSDEPQKVAAVAVKHGAHLVALPVNQGPAAARNAGLREVTTPFVAFADSDVAVTPDALALLLRHFADDRIAVAAPRIVGRAGTNWIARYEAACSSLDLGPEPALVKPGSRIAWLPSACFAARVAALADGFDERLRCGEDVDLMWRLAEKWRIRYDPSVHAMHEHRDELWPWLARKKFYGTSAAPLASRHGDVVAPAVLTPWIGAVSGLLLVQRKWSVTLLAVLLAITGYRASCLLEAPPQTRAEIGARLAVRLLTGSATQASALLVRHWWPIALTSALFSRRARRALLLAVLTDGLTEYRHTKPQLDPVRFLVARRLDDLAYGSGVWAGAIRQKAPRALLPRMRGFTMGGLRPQAFGGVHSPH
ncbi:mycofactocin biosynthesis glycosyltransferase MftF [Hoyosella subflava]|uniref:Glycosyl transferase family 2 n=1 Tax=Hoyosella subflava (strain DSM 45089 / JCM 17490 / NBRC 109087 / DQS3-9A1) TaxID=443218 RepID=F6EM18_HOYSD|nr:mycofactocin biosynthesis glycosyltransferase MftF [Hoyosella subflava]AEF42799.1 Glycosyl transferase family 2 [Hoyosella subflava DQS3-9A1]